MRINTCFCEMCYTVIGSQNKYKLSPKMGKEMILATTLIYIFLVLFWYAL